MKHTKKLLSLLLVLCLILSLSCTAFAADEAKPLTGKTVILHSNDVHGAIDLYAAMASLKADYEAQGAEVILADAGDYSQGTVYVSVHKGADAVTMMNATGYDVATIGNHEFDYGYAQLAENMKAAKFKVLCADVLGTDGKTIFDANTIIEKGGALEVTAAATHGVLSGPAIERIADSPIKELILLDTVPVTGERKLDKMTILSVAPLFAEAIERIYEDKPVSPMFL